MKGFSVKYYYRFLHRAAILNLLFQAFVHDPLINWRLFVFNEVPQMSNYVNTHTQPVVNGEESAPNKEFSQPLRGARERELLQVAYRFSY